MMAALPSGALAYLSSPKAALHYKICPQLVRPLSNALLFVAIHSHKLCIQEKRGDRRRSWAGGPKESGGEARGSAALLGPAARPRAPRGRPGPPYLWGARGP